MPRIAREGTASTVTGSKRKQARTIPEGHQYTLPASTEKPIISGGFSFWPLQTWAGLGDLRRGIQTFGVCRINSLVRAKRLESSVAAGNSKLQTPDIRKNLEGLEDQFHLVSADCPVSDCQVIGCDWGRKGAAEEVAEFHLHPLAFPSSPKAEDASTPAFSEHGRPHRSGVSLFQRVDK